MGKKKQKQQPKETPKKPKSRIVAILIPILVAFLSIGFATYLYFYVTPPLPRNYNYNKGTNAAWVRHQVFSEPLKGKDLDVFTSQLTALEISTIYIHVGPLDAKGKIPEYDLNIWQTNRRAIRERLPAIKIQAWLGGINSTKFGKAPDTLDMNDKKVMQDIALLAGNLAEKAEFDGIHYDIEPLPVNDQGFIYLLQKTREVIGKKTLSVASPMIASNDTIVTSINNVGKNTMALWGPSYYRKVAENCDEIAVMSYDSLTLTPASYRRFMMYQITALTNVLKGTSCRLLIGIPTYEERTISHKPEVENLQTALEGTILGMQKAKNLENIDGVAIYALWTTDDTEIQQYRKLWLRKQ